MISIKKLFLLLLVALPSLGFAQNSFAEENNDEYIDWSASRRLVWTDYKSDPDPNSDAAATTTTFLGLEYTIRNGIFSYRIACKFSRNKSWGLHQTDHILGHEQGHFDITEIFARKLNKLTSEYQFNKRTYQKDIKKIYNDLTREKEAFQHQYDEETDYSRNKTKQAEWLKKIEGILEEYKDFAYYSGESQQLVSQQKMSVPATNNALKGKKANRR